MRDLIAAALAPPRPTSALPASSPGFREEFGEGFGKGVEEEDRLSLLHLVSSAAAACTQWGDASAGERLVTLVVALA